MQTVLLFLCSINTFAAVFAGSSAMKSCLIHLKIDNMLITAISFLSIISAGKFLFTDYIKNMNIPIFSRYFTREISWMLLGQILSSIGIIFTSLTNKYEYIICNLVIVMLGEIFHDVSFSKFQVYLGAKKGSWLIFSAHKLSAFLAIIISPLMIKYTSLKYGLRIIGVLSFLGIIPIILFDYYVKSKNINVSSSVSELNLSKRNNISLVLSLLPAIFLIPKILLYNSTSVYSIGFHNFSVLVGAFLLFASIWCHSIHEMKWYSIIFTGNVIILFILNKYIPYIATFIISILSKINVSNDFPKYLSYFLISLGVFFLLLKKSKLTYITLALCFCNIILASKVNIYGYEYLLCHVFLILIILSFILYLYFSREKNTTNDFQIDESYYSTIIALIISLVFFNSDLFKNYISISRLVNNVSFILGLEQITYIIFFQQVLCKIKGDYKFYLLNTLFCIMIWFGNNIESNIYPFISKYTSIAIFYCLLFFQFFILPKMRKSIYNKRINSLFFYLLTCLLSYMFYINNNKITSFIIICYVLIKKLADQMNFKDQMKGYWGISLLIFLVKAAKMTTHGHRTTSIMDGDISKMKIIITLNMMTLLGGLIGGYLSERAKIKNIKSSRNLALLAASLGVFDFLCNFLVLSKNFWIAHVGDFIEHVINGFGMCAIMNIIYRISIPNPIFLHSIMWGAFSLSRSIFGSMSGVIEKNWSHSTLNWITGLLLIPPFLLIMLINFHYSNDTDEKKHIKENNPCC